MPHTRLAAIVLLVSAHAGAATLEEAQAAHRAKCGGSVVFEVDESLKKLASGNFNPADRCAGAAEAAQQFCTEWEVRNLGSQMQLEDVGIDLEVLAKDPSLKLPLAELTKIRCVASPGAERPTYEWKGTEITIGFAEGTANLYEDTYPRVRGGWLTRAGTVFGKAFAAQAAQRFEKQCGAKVTATYEPFPDEALYGRTRQLDLARACARVLHRELANSCDAKLRPAVGSVTAISCGPDAARADALTCLKERFDAKEDEQEKMKATMKREKYTAKKVSAACEAKLKALNRMPPTFTWKGGTLAVGLLPESMDYEDIGRAFRAALKK